MTLDRMKLVGGRPFQGGLTRRFGRPTHGFPVVPTLPSETPLGSLAGRRVLCIMDDDNIRIGLRSLGFALSYRTLRARLCENASSLESWVVLSDNDGAVARGRYLERRDWEVVQVPRQVVVHRGVPTVKGNVDHELAFLAGRQSGKAKFDAVLLGTGDGDLAVAVARCLREYTTALVATLSVPGCSSRRLVDTGLFAERVLIGRDLVVRVGRSRAGGHAARTRLIV